ncbi:MAG: hypothetical protein U0136_17520 [Bdellovibrionota bacterium]
MNVRAIPRAYPGSPNFEEADHYHVSDRVRAVRTRFVPGRTVLFHGLESSGSASFADAIARAYRQMEREGRLSPGTGAYVFYTEGMAADLREIFSGLASLGSYFHFIYSHSLYGSHRFLNRPSTYATLLREPRERVLSLYNFHRSVSPATVGPIEEWLSDRRGVAHTQTWRLAFEFNAATAWGSYPARETLLELARENLTRQFQYVGITELFEESLFLFCDRFGIPSVPTWCRFASTPGRLSLDGLSTEARERLEDLVAGDLILYDEYKAKLLAELGQKDFGSELSRYKRDMAGE